MHDSAASIHFSDVTNSTATLPNKIQRSASKQQKETYTNQFIVKNTKTTERHRQQNTFNSRIIQVTCLVASVLVADGSFAGRYKHDPPKTNLKLFRLGRARRFHGYDPDEVLGYLETILLFHQRLNRLPHSRT